MTNKEPIAKPVKVEREIHIYDASGQGIATCNSGYAQAVADLINNSDSDKERIAQAKRIRELEDLLLEVADGLKRRRDKIRNAVCNVGFKR